MQCVGGALTWTRLPVPRLRCVALLGGGCAQGGGRAGCSAGWRACGLLCKEKALHWLAALQGKGIHVGLQTRLAWLLCREGLHGLGCTAGCSICTAALEGEKKKKKPCMAGCSWRKEAHGKSLHWAWLLAEGLDGWLLYGKGLHWLASLRGKKRLCQPRAIARGPSPAAHASRRQSAHTAAAASVATKRPAQCKIKRRREEKNPSKTRLKKRPAGRKAGGRGKWGIWRAN